MTYDLSEAVMTADKMLDIRAYASNVRVDCPIGVRVQMTGEGILSNLQCSAPIPEAEAAPEGWC